MKFETFAATNQGPREYQQDRFLIKDNLLVIADGMGGPPKGDEAAEACTKAFDDLSATDKESMYAAILIANRACQQIPARGRMRGGPGSTCTAVHLGETCEWVHVGDTRISVVTVEKHTYITKDQGRGHVLYNCVGNLDTTQTASGSFTGLEIGDAVVLTTDGVHDLLDSQGPTPGDLLGATVRVALAKGIDPAQLLIDACLNIGPYDNITVVVAVRTE